MTTEEIKADICLYGKEIYSFCCYLTKSKIEADDLYQDVFLKVLEKRDRKYYEEDHKKYLLQLTIKLWKSHWRKIAWRTRIAPTEYLEADKTPEIKDTSIGPEGQILQEEESKFLINALNSLSDRYRIPVYLYYLNGLSQEEIAKCMELPLGTIKSRLYKAKQLLKEELEANGYDR